MLSTLIDALMVPPFYDQQARSFENNYWGQSKIRKNTGRREDPTSDRSPLTSDCGKLNVR